MLNKVDVYCHLIKSENDKENETSFDNSRSRIYIECITHCGGKTGVEMEALTGASVAALTIYDMCKSVNKAIKIENIQLEEKSGGKSGYYHHCQPDPSPPSSSVSETKY